MTAAQRWEEYIVPEQWLLDLRETSPGTMNSSPVCWGAWLNHKPQITNCKDRVLCVVDQARVYYVCVYLHVSGYGLLFVVTLHFCISDINFKGECSC